MSFAQLVLASPKSICTGFIILWLDIIQSPDHMLCSLPAGFVLATSSMAAAKLVFVHCF